MPNYVPARHVVGVSAAISGRRRLKEKKVERVIHGHVPHVLAGIRRDVEQLLNAFKESKSLRFKDFAQIFRSMDYSLIFAGRIVVAELAEFSEFLLQTCASYMLEMTQHGENAGYPTLLEDGSVPAEPYTRRNGGPPLLVDVEDPRPQSLTERVFGIYAAYAFFYLQPSDYTIQIRVTPAQMREIMKFANEKLRPERLLDVLGALFKLVADSAFRIVAYEDVYDWSAHLGRTHDVQDEADDVGEEVAVPLTGLKKILEDTSLRQLDLLHQRYEEAKRKFRVERLSVNAAKTPMGQEFKSIFMNAREEMHDVTNPAPEKVAARKRKVISNQTRADIKQAAYSRNVHASRSRRYAFGADAVGLQSSAEEDELAQPSTSAKVESPQRKKKRQRRFKRDGEMAAVYASEMAEELHEQGVDVVVASPAKRRRRQSTMRSEADEVQGSSTHPDLAYLDIPVGDQEEQQREQRPKRKRPASPPKDPEFMQSLLELRTMKEEKEANRLYDRMMKTVKAGEILRPPPSSATGGVKRTPSGRKSAAGSGEVGRGGKGGGRGGKRGRGGQRGRGRGK